MSTPPSMPAPSAMPDAIPYQTYRSKRNSHPHLIPNVSPLPISRPSTILQSLPPEKERNSVPDGTASPPVRPSELTPNPEPDARGSSLTMAKSTSPTASSSAQLSSPQPDLIPKKVSTFRHVPLRNARSPLPVSPLSVDSSTLPHDHDSSVNGAPPISQETNRLQQQSYLQVSDTHQVCSTTPSIHPPQCDSSHLDQPAPTVPIVSHALPITPTLSQAFNKSSQLQQAASSPPPLKSRAPYRPGFQPKGLYRPLTDEFVALRRFKRERGEHGGTSGVNRVERAKLTRRLEKLIDLHFSVPDSMAGGGSSGGNRDTRTTPPRMSDIPAFDHQRASSLFDLDIKNLSISDTADLWRGVVGRSKAHELRAAEQRITPWQDDADVTCCPLCNTSFHALTNRKHHCRLCGQVICSLPPKRPQRPVPCSLLFVVDSKTKIIEEVGEGVDYGVSRRSQAINTDEDKFLKGVRICRACRPILLRRQYQQEVHRVPVFVKLYGALIELEQEIEGALPRFHELVLTLSHNGQPTKDASATRKRLLEAFAQYDTLAKRIRKLPCTSGVGSSQDRVQMAVMSRAGSFLQKNMFSLQSLPTPQTVKTSTKLNFPDGEDAPVLDVDSKVAFLLQPLLEQEALLESFVEEAKAQRKFEDVQTLRANLVEIRAEIDRIAVNARSGMLDGVSS